MMIASVVVAGGALAVSGSIIQRRKKKSLMASLTNAVPSQISLSAAEEPTEEALATLPMQQVYRNLGLAALGTGLAGLGSFGLPLMTALSVPIIVYLCIPFVVNGYRQLVRERRIGIGAMDMVVSVAILGLGLFFIAGIFLIFYNISVAMVIKSRNQSADSLVDLIGKAPQTAWIEIDGVEIERSVSQLEAGDIIIVHSSEAIPVDGTVVGGLGSVDQHMLTGESQPAEKETGDRVFAATTVLRGQLQVQVESTGSDTVAAQIEQVLNDTATYQSNLELRGQAIADKSTIPTLALSALTLPVLGPSSAIAVLFSYFGYNMRIVGPLSVLNFLRLAMERNILVKDGRALEALQTVDSFVFDKTGTLTLEQPQVNNIHVTARYTEDEVLRYAAAAEHRQTHPVAHAIREAAEERSLALPPIDEANYEVGYGIRVHLEERLVRVGSERFMRLEEIALPDDLTTIQERSHAQGNSLVFVAVEDELVGVLEMAPTIRPEVPQMVQELYKRGMSLFIISGDEEAPTRYLASQIGIENYYAQVLPEDKAALIERLQAEGRQACFVGDGINDSIALKKANVSISLRGASTIATDTAQVVLMDQSLKNIVPLLDLTQELDKNMANNLRISIIPSVCSLAGIYLFHFGIIAANVIYCAGLAAAVGNAMLPTLKKHINED